MTAEEMVRKAIDEEWAPDDPYTLETSLDEFNVDSLERIELVMVFEEQLGVIVPDQEVADLKTVGDLVELVRRYGKDKLT